MSKRTQLYTTAPETYDGFGTKTVKIVGRIKDRDVRLVETPQEHATWQLMRYHSGAVYMVADEREWQEILRYKLAEPLEGVSHYEGMSLKALKRERERILDEIDAWESGAKATIGQPATGENYARVMRENLKNLLSQLAKIESALLEKSSKGLGEVARYDMQKLHVLIAEKLGWSVEDTHKFSLQMLREMVKDKSPKLAHEISNALRSGDHLYGKPLRGRR